MPAATKSITLQEDKPSLRVTSTCARSANFASASDFAILKCLSGLEIDYFHEISASEHPTSAPMQTLVQLRIFPQPMDRAEALHAATYDNSTCPLPQRILLSKRTSRLYESLPQPCAAPFLRKQSDFAILEALNPSEIALFAEFSASSRTTGAPMKTLD